MYRGGTLQVLYRTKKLEKVCTNLKEAVKHYGDDMAEKIHLRVSQIRSIDNVEDLVQYRVGRCHMLEGNREGEYAMDLVHPYRLVFVKIEEDIQIAKVINIEDYH